MLEIDNVFFAGFKSILYCFYYFRYGVDQFILICPDEKSKAILSEAQSKLLLSSVSLAISNTGWYVLLSIFILLSHILFYLFISFSFFLNYPPLPLPSLVHCLSSFRYRRIGVTCIPGSVRGVASVRLLK